VSSRIKRDDRGYPLRAIAGNVQRTKNHVCGGTNCPMHGPSGTHSPESALVALKDKLAKQQG
jgi:hypothetical protein